VNSDNFGMYSVAAHQSDNPVEWQSGNRAAHQFSKSITDSQAGRDLILIQVFVVWRCAQWTKQRNVKTCLDSNCKSTLDKIRSLPIIQ
jgi:hypothetical protein